MSCGQVKDPSPSEYQSEILTSMANSVFFPNSVFVHLAGPWQPLYQASKCLSKHSVSNHDLASDKELQIITQSCMLPFCPRDQLCFMSECAKEVTFKIGQYSQMPLLQMTPVGRWDQHLFINNHPGYQIKNSRIISFHALPTLPYLLVHIRQTYLENNQRHKAQQDANQATLY